MPKRALYRRIETHAVYTIGEIVTRFKTSKVTIKRLVRDHGLPIYDDRGVALVHGADLKAAFVALYERRRQKPHESYCLTCKASRRMRLDSLEVQSISPLRCRIAGVCELCGGAVNRITRSALVEPFKTALGRSYSSGSAHCLHGNDPSDGAHPRRNLAFPSRAAANLRLRRRYLRHLEGGRGFAQSTIASYVGALEDYDAYTNHRDYKSFSIEDAEGFRMHLRETVSSLTGKPLSLTSIRQKLGAVQAFFVWLSSQEGYRRAITVGKYEQLNLTRRELAVARVRDPRDAPTLEEVEQVLDHMPSNTEIEKRDRALVAFLTITGVRIGALTDLRLKHVNLARRTVRQDPRDVRTKFGKDIVTTFFPVSETAEKIFTDYVNWLRGEMAFEPEDPLFPRSRQRFGPNEALTYEGLDPRPWKSAQAPRRIVNHAFGQVGCPPYGPHAFRHMIVQEGNRIAATPEEIKAWSQNIGHSDVRTTQHAYGTLSTQQQTRVIDAMRARGAT